MGSRLWSFFCSLKLAIVLASFATLLVMGGSLAMHFNPAVFGDLDRMLLADWWLDFGRENIRLAWWLPMTGTCLLLLAVNTFCCFFDWVRNWRKRWRKTGEYLIHAGFVLVAVGFFWGSLAGFRTDGNRLGIGETIPVPNMPGLSLQLKHFEPVLNSEGRPLDMRNTLILFQGKEPVRETVARINHPLSWRGLVVVPTTFGQFPTGFRFHRPGQGVIILETGTVIDLPTGGTLRVLSFHPDAIRTGDGKTVPTGRQVGNPALELELEIPYREPWHGWYFLREALPFPLIEAGLRIWPTEPAYRFVSVFTINRDPGSGLALAGGILIFAGVLLAMFSYYYKRSRGDRPQVE